MTNPTVREIVRNYLESHGFDGLCNPGLGCSCSLDEYTCVCSDMQESCFGGYAVPDPDMYGATDMIVANKPLTETPPAVTVGSVDAMLMGQE